MLLRPLYYIIFFVFANYSAQAQVAGMPVVSGEFRNITPEQFLLQLERETGFRFYFDTTQLDSIIINISVNKQALPEVLSSHF